MEDEAKPVAMLRQISTHALMRYLVQGPRSRADLARETGFSKQTTSEVIRTLDTAGWVVEQGLKSTGVGRQPLHYAVNPDAGVVLGVDISATRVVLGLCDAVGQRVATEETRMEELGAPLIDALGALCQAFLASHAQGRPLQFACLSTPGIVEPGTGKLSSVRNLPDLMGVDLEAVFSEALGCEIAVENDVNAALVGESWCGCAGGANDVAYIGLGTGVGLGLMVQGRLLRGARGAAGEVSHLPIGADSRDSEALSRGTLERVLGVRSILAPVTKARSARDMVAEFVYLVGKNDPAAMDILGRIGSLSAQLVLSVQAIVDPEVVVIGGMLGLVPGVVDVTRAELAARTPRPVQILDAGLGAQSTITGACYIALTGMYNATFSPQLEARLRDTPWPIRLPDAPIAPVRESLT